MNFINVDWASIDWGPILQFIGKALGGASGVYAVYRFVIKPFVIKPMIKSIIDEELSDIRDDARRYMLDALRYKNDAREDKKAVAQIKEAVAQDREEIAKKAIAINSLLSSAQERSIIDTIGTKTSEDANTEILEDYLES